MTATTTTAAGPDGIRDRGVADLTGRPAPGVPDPGHPFVLVARDLAPAGPGDR